MKKLILASIASACLLSSPCHAEAGWTESGRIIALEANIHGRTLVQLAVKKNPSGCREKQWFHREWIGETSIQMMNVLLAAAANDKTVRLRVTGLCHLKGYSEISAVAMEP